MKRFNTEEISKIRNDVLVKESTIEVHHLVASATTPLAGSPFISLSNHFSQQTKLPIAYFTLSAFLQKGRIKYCICLLERWFEGKILLKK